MSNGAQPFVKELVEISATGSSKISIKESDVLASLLLLFDTVRVTSKDPEEEYIAIGFL